MGTVSQRARPRICPGRFTADNSVFMAIATMLHVLQFEKALDKDGKEIALDFTTVEYARGLGRYVFRNSLTSLTMIAEIPAVIRKPSPASSRRRANERLSLLQGIICVRSTCELLVAIVLSESRLTVNDRIPARLGCALTRSL